jgi:hypothetical protein
MGQPVIKANNEEPVYVSEKFTTFWGEEITVLVSKQRPFSYGIPFNRDKQWKK